MKKWRKNDYQKVKFFLPIQKVTNLSLFAITWSLPSFLLPLIFGCSFFLLLFPISSMSVLRPGLFAGRVAGTNQSTVLRCSVRFYVIISRLPVTVPILSLFFLTVRPPPLFRPPLLSSSTQWSPEAGAALARPLPVSFRSWDARWC